jgi:hypothetical protein
MYNRGKKKWKKKLDLVRPTTEGKREKSLPIAWIFFGGGASSVSLHESVRSRVR